MKYIIILLLIGNLYAKDKKYEKLTLINFEYTLKEMIKNIKKEKELKYLINEDLKELSIIKTKTGSYFIKIIPESGINKNFEIEYLKQ